MLSKCANPSCSALFLYLHQGKLFRMETSVGPGNEAGANPAETRKPVRKLEYFWLCQECCRSLTLTFDRAAGIGTRRILKAQAASAS
jgi:hypothetical protein